MKSASPLFRFVYDGNAEWEELCCKNARYRPVPNVQRQKLIPVGARFGRRPFLT